MRVNIKQYLYVKKLKHATEYAVYVLHHRGKKLNHISTIPDKNIPDNSFLTPSSHPHTPQLQCWIWQNLPHSTLCFKSEVGGGENHELSGNFHLRLSEFSKKIKLGGRSLKYSEYLNIASWSSCLMKKDLCLPPPIFSTILKRSVVNFCFPDSLGKIKTNIRCEFVQNPRQEQCRTVSEEKNFFTLTASSLRNEHYLQTKQYTLNIKRP